LSATINSVCHQTVTRRDTENDTVFVFLLTVMHCCSASLPGTPMLQQRVIDIYLIYYFIYLFVVFPTVSNRLWYDWWCYSRCLWSQ